MAKIFPMSTPPSPKILIVTNIRREGPGILAEVFGRARAPFEILDFEAGDSFPPPGEFSALVVMGGPDSANDKTPKMKTELTRVREYVNAGVPYLGVCLGLQVLVKALGGKVVKSPVKEVGFRGPDGKFFEVDLTEEGRRDPLFQGIASPAKVFQLHGETVQLTPGMQLLAQGKFCPVQIVKAAPKAWGFQGHFELTPEMFNHWKKEDTDLSWQDAAALDRDYAAIRKEYETTGRQIAANFLAKIRG